MWIRQCIISLFVILFSPPVLSGDYSAIVSSVDIEMGDQQYYYLNTNIEYRLSPTAKEALQKGIALTWVVAIKLKQESWLWDTTVEEGSITYTIKNHGLLNLYSVESNGVSDMFSTLTAALNAISKIRKIPIIKKELIQANEKYQLVIKVTFDREALPVPLRPISYFDPQWALSSQWTTWPLQR